MIHGISCPCLHVWRIFKSYSETFHGIQTDIQKRKWAGGLIEQGVHFQQHSR